MRSSSPTTGALGAFQIPNRFIGVDADDEQITLRPRESKIFHVAQVDEVEAAVGEDDAPPGRAVDGELFQQRVELAFFSQVLVRFGHQFEHDLVGLDRHRAEAFDLQAARDVGERDGVDPIRPGGAGSAKCREHHVARAGDVCHLSGAGAHAALGAVAGVQVRAVFVERDDDGLEHQGLQKLLRRQRRTARRCGRAGGSPSRPRCG